MTIRTLWLFSYVGMGLALAVGNRLDVPSSVSQKQDHGRDKANEANSLKNNLHMRAHQYEGSRRGSVHDWLVYEDQSANGPPTISRTGINDPRRYPNVLFEDLGPPPVPGLLPGQILPREPLPFIYEEALFQQHHNRKRPGGFKPSKKVVGLPPLVYGGTEEETPPGGQTEPRDRARIDEMLDHNSRSGDMPFENLGGLPFEPPDSSHKPQGGGIGLSPLLFDTDKPPGKRNPAPASGTGGGHYDGQSSSNQNPSPPGGAAIASQFMLRSARGNRQYDVPQIECPSSEDGMERFACPTPDRMGRYRCIDDHVLCDGFIDCPTGEDEDRQACMFYKTTKAHLDVLADALLRWARGR